MRVRVFLRCGRVTGGRLRPSLPCCATKLCISDALAPTKQDRLFDRESLVLVDRTAIGVASMSLQSTLHPIGLLMHPTRWRIVARLLEESLSADALACLLGLRQTNVSNHLQLLRKAGVIEWERHRRCVRYRVASQFVSLIPRLRGCLGVTDATDPVLPADAWNSRVVPRA